MEAEVVRMTSRGNLNIPQDIRDSLGLKEGDAFLVVEEPEGILLRPVKQELLEDAAAQYHSKRAWESIHKGEGEVWTLENLRRGKK